MGVLPRCMSALCVGSTCGGQKNILDALGLELQTVLSCCASWELNLNLLEEQPLSHFQFLFLFSFLFF